MRGRSLNRIQANRGHDIGEILKKFDQAKPFGLRLTEPCKKFLFFLDTYGRHRYFESSWYVKGGEIVELDRAVWEVRRYARTMRYEFHSIGGAKINALPIEIKRNIDAECGTHRNFTSPEVFWNPLSKRLTTQQGVSFGRTASLGKSRRRTVRLRSGLQAANSPLTLHPELLDEVLKDVWLPKDVIGRRIGMQDNPAVNREIKATNQRGQTLRYPHESYPTIKKLHWHKLRQNPSFYCLTCCFVIKNWLKQDTSNSLYRRVIMLQSAD